MSAAATTHDVFRVHGGKVEAARAAFPGSPEPWIDLSTGICPWSYPLTSPPSSAFTRLPEPEVITELEQAAASCFGVADPSRVIATPGSDQALRIAGALLKDKHVAVVRPGYSGHILAWKARKPDEIVAEELDWAARNHDVVVLANPNNPDGRTIRREHLIEAAEVLASRGGVLLVDEAFADAAPELSVSDAAGAGLIVFRSFGKFFGLAGLRLGFVIANAEWAAGFRQLLGDWPITGPTAVIATAAYRDREWQTAQRARLANGAARLNSVLNKSRLEVIGGTVLFRLARACNADAVFRQLTAAGILTRPFANDPTLLRVGLPSNDSQWKRLEQALGVRP